MILSRLRGDAGGVGVDFGEGISVEAAGDGSGEGRVWRAVELGEVVGRNVEGGLADGEGAVDVDDVVVGEVRSGCKRHDRIGANLRGDGGRGGLGEGECVVV